MSLIKKPRGRPRKDPIEDEVKKPRGRPRKNPIEDEVKKPIERPRKDPIEDEVKKPRGRPRKDPNEDEVKKPTGRPRKDSMGDEVKKPTGRPRKDPIEDEVKKPTGRPRKDSMGDEVKKPTGRPRKDSMGDEVKKPTGRPRKDSMEDEVKKHSREEGIDDERIRKFHIIRDLLKDVDNLKIVGNDIYIGDVKIIKRIGTDSKNGIVLLGEINKYNIAIKISKFNPKKTNELDTLKMVTNEYIRKRTNHLPLLYEYKIYNGMKDYEKYPKTFQKFLKGSYIIYFNELADGDLFNFLKDNYANDDLIINALFQILMSLVNFYKTTGKFHYDSHAGNFLYHKISKTDDFEYKFEDKKYKIKNLGYLFVIWDLEKSISFEKHINYRINYDFEKILLSFLNEDDKIPGYMSAKKPYGIRVKKLAMSLFKELIFNDKASFFKLGYSKEKLNDLISIIFKNYLSNLDKF
jgi:hypothetical protein